MILIFLGSCSFLRAQENDNFAYFDSLTYRLYQEENWKSLSRTSSKAIRKGYDYYYMRVRKGIALYERKNYMAAIRHFRKAQGFNSLDKVSYDYLLFAKVNSGREKEAQVYTAKNKEYLSTQIYRPKNIRSFSFGGIYQFNPEISLDLVDNRDLTSPDQTGNITIPKRFLSAGFLLTHDLSSHFSLTHGGQLLLKKSYSAIFEPGVKMLTQDFNTRQIQYYASLGFYTSGGLILNSSVHVLGYSIDPVSYLDRNAGMRYTQILNKDQDLIYRISAGKYLGNFFLRAGASFSSLNGSKQKQQDLQIIFFPLGNLNFYTKTSFYYIDDKSILSKDSKFVFHQGMGYKILPGLWNEIDFYTGTIQNMNMEEGVHIYNGLEKIDHLFNFVFIIPFKTNAFRISAGYQKQSFYYLDSSMNLLPDNYIESNGFSINTSMQWNF